MNYEDGDWVISEDGRARAAFIDAGEGLGGDYDPGDRDDVALLRLDVQTLTSLDPGTGEVDLDDPEWTTPDAGSVCTQVPVGTDPATQVALLQRAADQVAAAAGGSVRSLMDRLSWLPGNGPQVD